jgi:hypothetical protein
MFLENRLILAATSLARLDILQILLRDRSYQLLSS